MKPRLTPKEAISKLGSGEGAFTYIREATDTELDEYIDGVALVTPVMWKHATAEREKRFQKKASTPHWTLVPTFWLVIAGVILAACQVILPLLTSRTNKQPTPPPPLGGDLSVSNTKAASNQAATLLPPAIGTTNATSSIPVPQVSK